MTAITATDRISLPGAARRNDTPDLSKRGLRMTYALIMKRKFLIAPAAPARPTAAPRGRSSVK